MDVITFVRADLACAAGRRECARAIGAGIATCGLAAVLSLAAWVAQVAVAGGV